MSRDGKKCKVCFQFEVSLVVFLLWAIISCFVYKEGKFGPWK